MKKNEIIEDLEKVQEVLALGLAEQGYDMIEKIINKM